MDKLKKTIELIESHQNPLDHYVVDPGVNLTVKEMFDVLIIEIEQLRKEKEWLANKVIRMGFMLDILPFGERKKVLTEEMQQALKERE